MIRRVLSRRPEIVCIDGLLSAAECRRLQALGAHRMRKCALSDVADASAHERSSTGCWLPRGDMPRSLWAKLGASAADADLVASVEARISQELGIPADHGEPAQILRYKVGQQYEAHPDFFNPRDREELDNGGQRVRTCLVYLSTVPDGCRGATAFPRLDLRVQPVRGRALHWRNVKPNGAVDPLTIHAGELVVRGRRMGGSSNVSSSARDRARAPIVEKWVLSKWVRERPFTVDTTAGF